MMMMMITHPDFFFLLSRLSSFVLSLLSSSFLSFLLAIIIKSITNSNGGEREREVNPLRSIFFLFQTISSRVLLQETSLFLSSLFLSFICFSKRGKERQERERKGERIFSNRNKWLLMRSFGGEKILGKKRELKKERDMGEKGLITTNSCIECKKVRKFIPMSWQNCKTKNQLHRKKEKNISRKREKEKTKEMGKDGANSTLGETTFLEFNFHAKKVL